MAALTEKEIAIRSVIVLRIEIITERILPKCKDIATAEYYHGKIDGLKQAYQLLGESLDSITIELF